jgi:hypothetical protein
VVHEGYLLSRLVRDVKVALTRYYLKNFNLLKVEAYLVNNEVEAVDEVRGAALKLNQLSHILRDELRVLREIKLIGPASPTLLIAAHTVRGELS